MLLEAFANHSLSFLNISARIFESSQLKGALIWHAGRAGFALAGIDNFVVCPRMDMMNKENP